MYKWIEIGAIAIGIFAVVFQIFPSQTTRQQTVSVVFFVAILCYIALLYVYDYFYGKVKFYIGEISNTSKEVCMIKSTLDIQQLLHSVDKRLSLLEAINKKGGIDTRYILFLILLILFYLYLRSLGIVP